MKFSCGMSKATRVKEAWEELELKAKCMALWNKKFAWLPVTVETDPKGKRTCVWLEYVDVKYPFAYVTEAELNSWPVIVKLTAEYRHPSQL